MRNAIRKKLHSQAGASLLIALIFFLAAMMVGAVVLTAASTNAGRLARNRQEQQDYLAVASAARLVEEDFSGGSFTAGYTKTVTTTTISAVDRDNKPLDPQPEAPETPPQYAPSLTSLNGGSILLSENPMSNLELLYRSSLPADVPFRATAPGEIKYDLSFESDKFPKVSGSIAIGNDYAITVTLYIENGSEKLNVTTLRFASRVSPNEETVKAPETSSETTDAAGNIITTHTQVSTTTYSTTVTWAEPVITKGATP